MKRFAVIGSPITHSQSPTLHRAAFEYLNLPWTYDSEEVAIGEMDAAIGRHQWDGISVTMPLKDEAFGFAIERDQIATATGVVNTLVRQEVGYFGANTDVPGMINALTAFGFRHAQRAIVIGNGATARSAVLALQSRASQIAVMARNHRSLQGVDTYLEWGQVFDADLVISTVPAGATTTLPSGTGLLFDVAYAATPPALTQRWDGPVVAGLELLIHQAALQTQLFVAPRPVDLDQIRSVMRQALGQ